MPRKPKLFGDRKAITPVLSNLLLTVVAVAAMALATTATYIITTNLRENMSERLITEDLWFKSSPREINIYLRNVGKVTVHISLVYINHTAQFSSPLSLEIGNLSRLNISYNWISGSLYYVDVLTSRGTHVGGYYKAP
jgi:hypothetical protein